MSKTQIDPLNERPYQQCSRCVMNTSAAEITFDDDGICNFCTEFLERSGHIIHQDTQANEKGLERLVESVKKSAKGKPYDCVVGVSGGVDSSWTLVKVKRLGLRPLAVHMDNGWNSELAQNNIENLISKLDVDLFTYVIDWDEYRKLMQSFFDADVIDIELLYDNALAAVCYKQARRFRLKYILAGTNQSTEGMKMPAGWNWYKLDALNIKAIGSQFGGLRLKSFPTYSTINYVCDRFVRKIQWVSFLDNLNYNKFEAIEVLKKEFNFKPYPYKHYESIFTRFYQGYILPNKFNVDKRLLHLGTLVVTGQLDRTEALNQLNEIPYSTEENLYADTDYFLKKMGWNLDDLKTYLDRVEINHDRYPNEHKFYLILKTFMKNFKLIKSKLNYSN